MLISTKLLPPSLRGDLLVRKHLVERLCAGDGIPVVTILGPAGSGKTSLASQWIEQKKSCVAWYSLDDEDNAPDLFFRYLMTALTLADQKLKPSLELMLGSQREMRVENITYELIEALSGLSEDVQLVLDDFHQITNGELHSSIATLMQHMPARLQIVILSRYSLPAPVDAAVQKMDRMEITAEQLKFSESETLDLFKKILQNEFSAHQIRDLNRHVEGWAAGLQLIGLVTKTKGLVPNLSAILNQAHDQIANYLIYDILRDQPQKIRNFIYGTVFLDRFNSKLCTEVTGMPDAEKILSCLEHMNLFLTPIDIERKVYRYHHMFSEVVRSQVRQTNPELICATLIKAAKWQAKNDHLEDALRSAFRSGDVELTADLMEDHIMRYIEDMDLATGLRWISKLPDSVVKQRPLLQLHQCTFLLIMMKPAKAKEIFSFIAQKGDQTLSRYSGDKLMLCRDFKNYLKCVLDILYTGTTKALAEFQILQNKFPPRDPLLTIAIDFMMVFIMISKGDFTLAEVFLEKINEAPASSNSGRIMRKKIYVARAKSLIARHRGQLNQAETIIRRVLKHLNQQEFSHTSVAFLLHRHLGHILYLQNEIEKAQEYATLAIKHCEYSGLLDEILAGNELELQLHLAIGDNKQAKRCIHKIRTTSKKLEMPSIDLYANVCAARLALNQNKIAAAQLWSRQRNLQPHEPFSLLFAVECLAQARLYYAQGHFNEMVALLDILRNRCVKRGLAELELQIDILSSVAFYAMNQIEKAMSVSKKALAFVQTQGYLRHFVNDSDLIAPVLQLIANESPCSLSMDYLERIFTACKIPLHVPDTLYLSKDDSFERLSQREIEILKWMAKGYQNKEIAQKAYISINTVKSHVRKILIKLNVKTRTQAIVKAEKMKLFEIA